MMRQSRILKVMEQASAQRVAAVLAFLGLLIATLAGFSPHRSQNAGSDFKTLYASAWCFWHHGDAYSIQNIAAVFRNDRVVEPRSWYGHSPVYPPFSLAIFGPIVLMPMVPALIVWIVVNGVLMALATIRLLEIARLRFGLGALPRYLIVALVASSPLLQLGLELGNVSVAVAALCILSLSFDDEVAGWGRSLCLAIGILLKPHIAIWPLAALLFGGRRSFRQFVRVTALLLVAVAAMVLISAVWRQDLGLQFVSYKASVLSELAGGSMAPGNRDILEIPVQITSLSSLIGYWVPYGVKANLATYLCLALGVAALGAASLRHAGRGPREKIAVTSAWCAFGMIASYHRAADGTFLLIVLPLIVASLLAPATRWFFCAVALVWAATTFGPALPMLQAAAQSRGFFAQVLNFAFLRQAALANTLLFLLLIGYIVSNRLNPASLPEKSGCTEIDAENRRLPTPAKTL